MVSYAMGDVRDKRQDDMSLLIEMQDPQAVFSEVHGVLLLVYPDFNAGRIQATFNDVVDLFQGRYPGYQHCNTEYHDLKHTTDIALAVTRLVHGMSIEGRPISQEAAELAVMGALLHDTGYIQSEDDRNGTGAKYTQVHVKRSVEFTQGYFKQKGYPPSEADSCGRMILSTDLGMRVTDIPFADAEEERGAKALLIADLIGQISDRLYLEKLLFLFREFSEAHVAGFGSEAELLEKTIGFYQFIADRLNNAAGYKTSVMRAHFKARWGLDRDLYSISIERNMEYLKRILKEGKGDHRSKLNRAGIVRRLVSMGL